MATEEGRVQERVVDLDEQLADVLVPALPLVDVGEEQEGALGASKKKKQRAIRPRF